MMSFHQGQHLYTIRYATLLENPMLSLFLQTRIFVRVPILSLRFGETPFVTY